jgi:hypothetical protein
LTVYLPVHLCGFIPESSWWIFSQYILVDFFP